MKKQLPKMIPVVEALSYLQQRGIFVSRQAVHGFIHRHRDQCHRVGGSVKKAGIWLIPVSLLRKYRPLEQQQQAGRVRSSGESSSFIYIKKEQDFRVLPSPSCTIIMRPPIVHNKIA